MPRPRNIQHVQVMLLDQPVEMDPDETLAGVGPPMAEQAALYMLGPKRLLEQRIVAQVKHPDAKVVAGAPVRVDQFDLLGRKVAYHLAPRFVRSTVRVGQIKMCSPAKRGNQNNECETYGIVIA